MKKTNYLLTISFIMALPLITFSQGVGINTTTPKSMLDVEGNVAIGATYSGTTAAPANGMIIEGDVGIGTSSPSYMLHLLAGAGGDNMMIEGESIGIIMHDNDGTANQSIAQMYLTNTDKYRIRGLTDALAESQVGITFELSNGNVGIGTTVPGAPLQVTASADNVIRSDYQGADASGIITLLQLRRETSGTAVDGMTGRLWFTTESDAGNQYSAAAIDVINTDVSDADLLTDMVFSVNGAGAVSEAMRITSNKYVGIGTTSIDAMLTIQGGNATEGDLLIAPTIGAAEDFMGFRVSESGNNTTDLHIGKNFTGANFVDLITIIETGDVGIGTTAPTELLEVSGGNIIIDNNQNNGALIINPSSAGIGVDPMFRLQTAEQGGGTDAAMIISRNSYFQTSDDSYYRDDDAISASHIRFKTNGDIQFSDAAPGAGAITWDDNMIIESDGDVGIGTTAPLTKLEINESSNNTTYSTAALTADDIPVYIQNTNNTNGNMEIISFLNSAGVGIAHVGATNLDHTTHSGDLFFATKPASGNIVKRMTIDEDGYVGIATTAPAVELEIISDATNSGVLKITSTDNQQLFGLTETAGTAAYMRMYDDAENADIQFNTVGDSYFNGGDLGIGTTNPTNRLDIQSSGQPTLRMMSTTAATASNIEIGTGGSGNRNAWIDLVGDDTYTDYGMRVRRYNTGANAISAVIHRGTGELQINAVDAGSINFYNNGSENMTITSTGNVGIGSTAPTAILDVAGTPVFTGCPAVCSDIRYKENIVELKNTLDKIQQVRGVNYDWKVNDFPEKNFSVARDVGFIAQEIEKIFPEVVQTDNYGFKTVSYAKLTPILLNGIKELKAEVDQLKARLNENENTGLNHK